MTSEYGIKEARQALGTLVARVQQGAEITLTRNGRPVARIVKFEEPTMTVTAVKSQLRAALLAEFADAPADSAAEVAEVIDAVASLAAAHRGEFHTYSDYLGVNIVATVA